MRCIFLIGFLLNVLPLLAAQGAGSKPQLSGVPELVVPVYTRLEDSHLGIPLVANGRAACAIVTPGLYRAAAGLLQAAIETRTGVKVSIIADTDAGAATPLTGNVIVLGNRSTSKISSELYDRFYSLMDLKYPGAGGYAVRSLHNPYGNGFSAILVGGSDVAGVAAGAEAFVANLTAPVARGTLTVGWTMLTKLGAGVKVPTDIREFEIWEASKRSGSVGYFGWNSISKRMAMFYMTGEPFHAREVLRLSFPDAQAIKEMAEIDEERIENKHDPLAGPYHYNAMMLILFWDLIEESPVFSDAERLKVTNAFARRFNHEVDRKGYFLDRVPSGVGNRHGQWLALSLFTLGRYFNKYYPSPMWAQAERAGRLHFASLNDHAYVEGESDLLFWYGTCTAPVLTYLILSGDRAPLKNGALQKVLRDQEIIISGLTPDWALNSSALDYFNKAAYLTGDGRWLTYRNRTGMDTDVFRLGQSFWPDETINPAAPDDLVGKWVVKPMFEQHWKKRSRRIKLEQSFENLSYRSAPDASGDFVLAVGYNGASRNPYHTYNIIELRLNGGTLLKGYHNQVLTSADGMVEPEVPMDAALLYQGVVGQVATVVAGVPDLPFVDWRRSLALRNGRYAIVADDLGFRSDQDNFVAETSWETPEATWDPQAKFLKIQPAEVPPAAPPRTYELHSSETMEVRSGKVTTMKWRGRARNGQRQVFFHLLGQNFTGRNDGLACLALSGNAAALALPDAAVAAVGRYEGLDGELVVLSENGLYGHAIQSAGLAVPLLSATVPVEADWDFDGGQLTVINAQPATLTLSVASPKLILNGQSATGRPANAPYTLNLTPYTFELMPGRHLFTGATLATAARKTLTDRLPALVRQARESRRRQAAEPVARVEPSSPVFVPVMQASIDARPLENVESPRAGGPVEGIVIPAPEGDQLCTAAGKTVTVIGADGRIVRRLTTAGDVRVLRWWAEPKLLLVGCADEQVIAFDDQGRRKWEFTSVMDPAVFEAAKQYWFKSAYPGVYGLFSGSFDGGKSRAFVGGACTLEILDEDGRLVKRRPVFWGPSRKYLIVDAADGSRNLLIGRWGNDYVRMEVLNSRTLELLKPGYDRVPPGHTFVTGWTSMNRYDNFLMDLNGDGKREVVSAINGTWNRISIYSEEGEPLYNAQFGPGDKAPRANLRMMDVGDINGDGNCEIVVGLSAGLVNALDARAKKLWVRPLSSPPTVVKIVAGSRATWLCVGSEDGTVMAMDGQGRIFKKGRVAGRPVDLQVLRTPQGPLAVMTTDTGEVSGFRRD